MTEELRPRGRSSSVSERCSEACWIVISEQTELSVDLRDIKAIIDLMKKNSVSEFELERQDFKIKLKRGGTSGGGSGPNFSEVGPALSLPIGVTSLPSSTHSGTGAPVEEPKDNDLEIKSPMIGTFYRAASPEATNYVEIGAEVGPDTVVCLIEAMKVMNEIKAEVRGVITEILIDNAKPVEFGQPLFKVRPK